MTKSEELDVTAKDLILERLKIVLLGLKILYQDGSSRYMAVFLLLMLEELSTNYGVKNILFVVVATDIFMPPLRRKLI